MSEIGKEDLKKAYRSKKDPKIRARILAAHMVGVYEESIGKTATNLMQSERWVRDWLKRHDEGGLDGLWDLPRSSSPCRTATFWARLRRFSPPRDSGTIKNGLGETQSGRFFDNESIGL